VTEPSIHPIPGFSEPVSSLSHLLGAGVFFALSLFLLRRGWGSWSRLFYLGVFTFADVFLLSMSGVYHLLAQGSGGRAVLQRLDHGAIFVLIAGTFTPVHGILFHGWLRWLPLLLIWSAAATGITLKTIFFNGVSEWLGLALYLGMGWIGIASGVLLYRRFGYPFVRPLLWGAVAYTLGAILEFLRWPILFPGVIHAHELFHLAVLAGLFLHWQFVMQFATGCVLHEIRPSAGNPALAEHGYADRRVQRRWRRTVRMVLETRLGPPSKDLEAALGVIQDLERLDGLLLRAATCASYEEFRTVLDYRESFVGAGPFSH